MFNSNYQLRLAGESHEESFVANRANIRSQLNSAFIRFACAGGESSAKLEVLHPYHGWHMVYLGNSYFIIKSPMSLDFQVLYDGIVETFARCNQWLTEDEKQHKKEMLLAQERELEAKIRRSRFRILESD